MNSKGEVDIPEHQLDIIFYHGSYPLWVYLKEVFGIDITEVCPRVAKEEPVLKTERCDLVVRVVDSDHENELDHMSNNDVIFLVNSINTVFSSLKIGVEKDGEKILESIKFVLDSNRNMRLVNETTDLFISELSLAVVKC